MKKIFNLLLICLAVTLYSSCSPKEDDIFGESSANRITEALKTDNTVLTSAANGWVMHYYPSAMQTYGGYNILVKFNTDGTAKVASDRFAPSTTETTVYDLSQSAGPLLSFNSYSKIIHYFSDPVNPDDIGTKGKGMEGDFEFRLIDVTPEKVVMTGKKTNSRIVMTPINASTSWEDYLTSISKAERNMAFGAYQYIVGTDTANVTLSYHSMTMAYKDKSGAVISQNVPYVITPNSFLLYDTLKIGGTNVTELTYKGGENYEFVTDGEGKAKMYGVVTPLNEMLIGGTSWYFSYDNLSSYGKPLWNTAMKNLFDKEQETLKYLYIAGTYVRFRSGSYNGYCTMTASLTGKNEITLKLSGYDGNGKYYYATKGYLKSFLNPLLDDKKGRTFTLSTDNVQDPQYIILTDTSDATNFIKLTKLAKIPPYQLP